MRDPSEDFALQAVEDGLGETADDRLADALQEAMRSTHSAADLVQNVRRLIVEDWQQRTEDVKRVYSATLRCVITDIEAAGPSAAKEATILRMAFGFRETTEESMRGLAESAGLSVEAISKRVEQHRNRHRLPLNSFNKSPQAIAKYRETNRATP